MHVCVNVEGRGVCECVNFGRERGGGGGGGGLTCLLLNVLMTMLRRGRDADVTLTCRERSVRGECD